MKEKVKYGIVIKCICTRTALSADVCLRSGSHVLCLERLPRIASEKRQYFHATHSLPQNTFHSLSKRIIGIN